jgi:hypothetical protein
MGKKHYRIILHKDYNTTYYTVQFRIFWLFWYTITEWKSGGFASDGDEPIIFDSINAAEGYIEPLRNAKKLKSQLNTTNVVKQGVI